MEEKDKLLKEMLVLLWLKSKGPLGRYQLKSLVDLSEGVMRGLLKRLSEEGLVKPRKYVGCELTKEGERRLKELLDRFKIVSIKEYDAESLKEPASLSVIVHLSKVSNKVRYGLEQRDAAVKAGALGATTLIFKDGKLLLPIGLDQVEVQENAVARKFIENFKLEDGDVLIIGFSNNIAKAMEGALAAALTTTTEKF